MLRPRSLASMAMLALAALGCGDPRGVAAPASSDATSSDDDGASDATEATSDTTLTESPPDAPCSRVHVGNVVAGDGIDLQSWAGIREITGDLAIVRTEPPLPDLSALSCLERVGGSVEVSDTTGLEDLTGLERVSFVGSSLVIHRNADLRSLEGLESLRYVGSIEIAGNPSLERLGLDHLQATKMLVVGQGCDGGTGGNASLTTLDGLDALLSLGTVQIRANPSLVSLAGLHELAERGVPVERLNAQDNRRLDPGEVEAAARALGTTASTCGNRGQDACPRCPS